MTGEPMHTASKERNDAMCPNINCGLKSEVSITLRCQLCSTHYKAVRIKNSSNRTSAIKVYSHYEKYGRFQLRKEVITFHHQIDTFVVNKDEWDTKENTGKSMKNALYVLQYSKMHLSGRSNIN